MPMCPFFKKESFIWVERKTYYKRISLALSRALALSRSRSRSLSLSLPPSDKGHKALCPLSPHTSWDDSCRITVVLELDNTQS